jgi:hypothetical protein
VIFAEILREFFESVGMWYRVRLDDFKRCDPFDTATIAPFASSPSSSPSFPTQQASLALCGGETPGLWLFIGTTSLTSALKSPAVVLVRVAPAQAHRGGV